MINAVWISSLYNAYIKKIFYWKVILLCCQFTFTWCTILYRKHYFLAISMLPKLWPINRILNEVMLISKQFTNSNEWYWIQIFNIRCQTCNHISNVE